MTVAKCMHAAIIMSDSQCYSTSDLGDCHQDSNLQLQLKKVSTDMGHVIKTSKKYAEITAISLLDPRQPHFALQHTSFYFPQTI